MHSCFRSEWEIREAAYQYNNNQKEGRSGQAKKCVQTGKWSPGWKSPHFSRFNCTGVWRRDKKQVEEQRVIMRRSNMGQEEQAEAASESELEKRNLLGHLGRKVLRVCPLNVYYEEGWAVQDTVDENRKDERICTNLFQKAIPLLTSSCFSRLRHLFSCAWERFLTSLHQLSPFVHKFA